MVPRVVPAVSGLLLALLGTAFEGSAAHHRRSVSVTGALEKN